MTRSGDVTNRLISGARSTGSSSSIEALGDSSVAALAVAWKWLVSQSGAVARRASRRLRVAETVSLGEKRFVSIVVVDGEQFLVGGSSSNIVLLAKLETKLEAAGGESFESVLSGMACGVRARKEDEENFTGVTL